LHCPDFADAAKHHSAWRRRALGTCFGSAMDMIANPTPKGEFVLYLFF
jgi:hypothetical protein